jgi:NAD(P)-dependent dehydrogenase (short-subunit alcohol dehydrogenase family)
MTYRFDNQTVVVTGGTGELGQHVTSILHGLGARLIVPFVSEQEMQAFSMRYPAVVQATRFVRLDAKDGEKVRRTIDQLVETEGVPHGLVNLIGGYRFGPPIVEAELDDLQRMLELNLAPTFHFCRSVLPHMLHAGRGHIVSVGARMGLAGSANHAAYSIAKAAIIRFTEALADEVKHHNINVNCVLPSIIDTARNRREMPAADFTHWVAPADLAHVIAFLLSDGARAVHGAAIPVYGRV